MLLPCSNYQYLGLTPTQYEAFVELNDSDLEHQALVLMWLCFWILRLGNGSDHLAAAFRVMNFQIFFRRVSNE